MSGNQEQYDKGDGPDAQVAAALARLGITLDTENGAATDQYLQGLNAAADRIKKLEDDQELISAMLAEVDYPVDADADMLAHVNAALTALDVANNAPKAGANGDAAKDARIEELEKELAAQKAKTSKAKKAASVAEAAAPATPRDVGPLKKQKSGRDLLEAIGDADQVELVFSDGQAELVDLKPRTISADGFELLGNDRVRLKVDELRVHGPRPGEAGAPYGLRGYGLLLDGKQVAWAGRPEQLSIGAGTQLELKDDVVFGPIED